MEKKITSKNNYNYTIVGAGIINSLEAIYLSRLKKKVIIIDSAKKIGGAWSTIDIFGYKNIENAIHYFLPSNKGIEFLKKNLNLKIKIVKNKFFFVNFFLLGTIKFYYDTKFSKIIRIIYKKESILKKIIEIICCLYEKYNNTSYYLSNGATEMLNKIDYLLKSSNVKIILNSKINKIEIDKISGFVKCHTNNFIINSKKIVLSNGSNFSVIHSNENNHKIKKIYLRRPAVHLLIKDNTLNLFKEVIFANDNLIKYVHDLTSFLKIKNKKIFVFALHNNVKKSKKNIYEIFNKIKNYRIICKHSMLLNYHWTETYLPPIPNDELHKIKNKFSNYVETLNTENFTQGIGYCSKKWSQNI
jgi:hypothetical protein